MEQVTLQEYTQQIDTLIEQNAYDEAIAHCRHILQQYPKYIQPYRLIGQAAWNREDFKNAADMFTRVLSAAPSDFVSRAGLSTVYEKQGALPEAVWQMERAYELEPGNEAIQEELRKLYAQGGSVPDKIPLTRGALARLYMNGELYSEAAAELRALLEHEPDRIDLQVLLAESLWRDEQRLEASEVALKILDKMPYCLDANLILGEIWMNGGREEDAQVCLKRAAALDPEGLRALALFGQMSPVSIQPVEIESLDYVAPAAPEIVEEAPTWLSGIGAQAEAGETAEEIPSWLQGIGLPAPGETIAEERVGVRADTTEAAPDWLASMAPVGAPVQQEEEAAPEWLAQLRAQEAPSAEEQAAAEALASAQDTEIPDWLQALRPTEAEPAATPAADETDWLAQLRVEPEPAAEAQAAPDWLSAFGAEPAQAEQEPTTPGEQEPEWLAQLHAQAGTLPQLEQLEAEAEPQAEMAAPEPGEIPDWLRELKPQGIEQAQVEPEAAEIPSWLQELKPTEAELQAPVAEAAQAEIPDWLQDLGPAAVEIQAAPSEELPDWLQALEPKEAEVEAPTAQAEIPDWLQALKPEEAASPVAEAEIPDWLQKIEPQPQEADLIPASEPAAVAPPAMPTEETPMPSPEEAMAFFARLTAGKETELAAQAQADAEIRMAEIMGRKPEAKPPVKAPEVKPAPVVAPKPEPVAPPPAAVVPPAMPTEETPMPSPEEAMAFFARLTAGKETELAAQAQADAEIRMAEIMGRKPEAKPPVQAPEVKPAPVVAPKPEPVAPPAAVVPTPKPPVKEPVAKPAPVVAPKPEPVAPPAMPTEESPMPSPEEAMAFFARLTAGKETELAAQAQADAEIRMAEIMGRKPEAKPPVQAPEVKPAPVVAPKPEPVAPPAMPTEETPMPSPEEAMAFFARLTAGKETELAAQAQTDAGIRMAEIMGRKPEAKPPVKAPEVKPALVVAPKPEPVAPPAPVLEIKPDEPVVELLPVEAVEEELPELADWLTAPAAIEAAAIPAASLPELAAEWEALTQPAAPAWPMEEIAPAETEMALAVEPEPIAEEPAPEAAPVTRQPVTGMAGPDWWYQTLEDEEGPIEEAAHEVTLAAGAVPVTEVLPVAQAAPVAPKPIPAPPAPVREVARPPEPKPAAPPAPEPAPARVAPTRLKRTKPVPATPPKPVVDIESIMTRLRANPDDQQALLDMARAWVTMEDMDAARGGYDELIRRNMALDDVIADLERITEDHRDDVDSLRLLGDAHMKAGHLQLALKLYRQALKKL